MKIELINISHSFEEAFGFRNKVLEDLTVKLDFPENRSSFYSFLAPDGSGKTTLLKVISRLSSAANGEVKIEDGSSIIPLLPDKALTFPWLAVKENIETALKANGINPDEHSTKVSEIIKFVGLEGYAEHIPNNKSFGFRFRIALARALVLGPKLILLDDSFRKMNELSKSECYSLILKVMTEKKVNFILATRNISEALLFSNKLFFLSSSPAEIIYEQEVKMSKKRSLKLLNSKEFKSLRNKIEKNLIGKNIFSFADFSF